MTHELQLRDYGEGYRFQVSCSNCGFQWYEQPHDVLLMPATHDNMYLDEVGAVLRCINCKQHDSKITPLLIRRTHHFVGGMA